MGKGEGAHSKLRMLTSCGQGTVKGSTGNPGCFLQEITFELGLRKRQVEDREGKRKGLKVKDT